MDIPSHRLCDFDGTLAMCPARAQPAATNSCRWLCNDSFTSDDSRVVLSAARQCKTLFGRFRQPLSFCSPPLRLCCRVCGVVGVIEIRVSFVCFSEGKTKPKKSFSQFVFLICVSKTIIIMFTLQMILRSIRKWTKRRREEKTSGSHTLSQIEVDRPLSPLSIFQ